jgi:hypothetical protein
LLEIQRSLLGLGVELGRDLGMVEPDPLDVPPEVSLYSAPFMQNELVLDRAFESEQHINHRDILNDDQQLIHNFEF